MMFKIDAFGGTAKITKLPAYPLNYHTKKDKVTSELVERGKAFAALSGYHYVQYNGIAIGDGPWGPVKYNVSVPTFPMTVLCTYLPFPGRCPNHHRHIRLE